VPNAPPRSGYADNLDFVEANAEELPFEDASFDAYTIAFGIRNVPDIPKALREAYRVLRRGGRFLCLEFSEVEMPMLDRVYDAWSFNGIPRGWKGDSRRGRALPYLVESIAQVPAPGRFRPDDRARRFLPRRPTPITPAGSRRFIRPGRSDRHASLGTYLRLMRAGFMLVREGVVSSLPADELPAPARFGHRVAGLLARRKARTAERMRQRMSRAVERLGPSWVKLGQFLATRPDVIAPRSADDLSGLQDRMATFPMKRLPAPKSKLRSAGRSTTLFEEIGAPVAAASIAQVHPAEGARRRTEPARSPSR
jgi:SAM-dependent methyltransferase